MFRRGFLGKFKVLEEEEGSDKELKILRVKGDGLRRAKSSRDGLEEDLSFFFGCSRWSRGRSDEGWRGWREAKARFEEDIWFMKRNLTDMF